jgi:competence ComEA-like helix-hairpin-helix protein
MKNDQNLLQFDYSEQDSMFYSSDQPINEEDSSQKIMEKEVASKRELLDFNVAKKVEKNTISSDFRAKLIDINSASIEQLASLPGIGKKTAELIIIYRNSIVRFSNAGELLNVKGIGKSKLEKIKKLIIVK